MSTYKKPRRESHAPRIRKRVALMDFDNRRERTAVTKKSCEKGARARMQQQHPNETNEEIQARVDVITRDGSKPTKAKVLEPGKIPPDVVAERRAPRKRQVKSGRHSQKGS